MKKNTLLYILVAIGIIGCSKNETESVNESPKTNLVDKKTKYSNIKPLTLNKPFG